MVFDEKNVRGRIVSRKEVTHNRKIHRNLMFTYRKEDTQCLKDLLPR